MTFFRSHVCAARQIQGKRWERVPLRLVAGVQARRQKGHLPHPCRADRSAQLADHRRGASGEGG